MGAAAAILFAELSSGDHLVLSDVSYAGIAELAASRGAVNAGPFEPAVADFYLTNPIARASAIMAECSATLGSTAKRTGTDG